MFASKSSIEKICKFYFRTLQIVDNVHGKSCEKLVAVSNDIYVYEKLRILVIEVHKSFMKTNADFMWDFYTITPVPKNNTTRYGLNYLIFRESLSWNNLPTSIKISQLLLILKII